MTLEKAFGQVIKRYRKLRGFSQAELSVRCSLDRAYISRLESGKQQPSLITLFSIAAALNIKATKITREIEALLALDNIVFTNNKINTFKIFKSNKSSDKKTTQCSSSANETILLVDDEQDALSALSSVFTKDGGYNVITASGGNDAVKIYKENLDKIRIVIIDILMPDIDGISVYKELFLLNPKVKVLFISGYSAQHIKTPTHLPFLQKPFSPTQLLTRIRELLAE